jgi:hypothetical protein
MVGAYIYIVGGFSARFFITSKENEIYESLKLEEHVTFKIYTKRITCQCRFLNKEYTKTTCQSQKDEKRHSVHSCCHITYIP